MRHRLALVALVLITACSFASYALASSGSAPKSSLPPSGWMTYAPLRTTLQTPGKPHPVSRRLLRYLNAHYFGFRTVNTHTTTAITRQTAINDALRDGQWHTTSATGTTLVRIAHRVHKVPAGYLAWLVSVRPKAPVFDSSNAPAANYVVVVISAQDGRLSRGHRRLRARARRALRPELGRGRMDGRSALTGAPGHATYASEVDCSLTQPGRPLPVAQRTPRPPSRATANRASDPPVPVWTRTGARADGRDFRWRPWIRELGPATCLPGHASGLVSGATTAITTILSMLVYRRCIRDLDVGSAHQLADARDWA